MDCDANSLLNASKCFCFSKEVSKSITIYLACAWANGGMAPEEQGFLLEDEGGYFLFDDGGRVMIQT